MILAQQASIRIALNVRSFLTLTLLLTVLATGAHAAEASLDVNDDAAKLLVAVPIGEHVLVDGAWLYLGGDGYVVSVAGHITNAASGDAPLRVGLGPRLFLQHYERDFGPPNEDGGAIGLGGFLRYTLPQYDRVNFGGSGYYAPEVLSLGDTDWYYEYGVDAGYSVAQDVDIYLGWRTVRAKFSLGSTDRLETGFHLGVRARF